MQLGVAGGAAPRSAAGARPGARPAYPVGERAAILDRPHLGRCGRSLSRRCPEDRCMLFIIAARLAAANPGGGVLEIAQRGPALLRSIGHMADAQDSLTDGELQSEIELVGDLVVAATSSDGPLPQEEIDRLLGVKADQEAAEQETGSAEVIEPGQQIDPDE